MQEIILYTDGSCLGNPGPGGWAAVLQHDNTQHEISGGENPTTNNRMEMMALIRGLEWIKKYKLADHPVHVFSDSNLVIQTLKQGWKRKKNQDLWAELDKARADLTCTWNWVKGHDNDPLNERCDELANAAAKKAAKRSPKIAKQTLFRGSQTS